jgi:hypothetical protein
MSPFLFAGCRPRGCACNTLSRVQAFSPKLDRSANRAVLRLLLGTGQCVQSGGALSGSGGAAFCLACAACKSASARLRSKSQIIRLVY